MTEKPGHGGHRDPDPSLLEVETGIEQATGVTGPINWNRIGLVAVGLLAAVLLAIQIMGGGATTDVVPGTPTTDSRPQ